MTAPYYCPRHDTYTFGECEGCADNLATRCDMRHGEQNVPNEQEEAR